MVSSLSAQNLRLQKQNKNVEIDSSIDIRIHMKSWQKDGDFIEEIIQGRITSVNDNELGIKVCCVSEKKDINGVKSKVSEYYDKSKREIRVYNKSDIYRIDVKRDKLNKQAKKISNLLLVTGIGTGLIGGYVTKPSERYIPIIAAVTQVLASGIIRNLYNGKKYKINEEDWQIL